MLFKDLLGFSPLVLLALNTLPSDSVTLPTSASTYTSSSSLILSLRIFSIIDLLRSFTVPWRNEDYEKVSAPTMRAGVAPGTMAPFDSL